MSATADKARYFLEQSVPELKEYEKKGIFTPQEISSISKRRSDFEHKINARGSTPADYAHYAEFEANVDALRRKRVKRLGIKSTAHNGQRRIFFIFDRGTRKFPGDVGLWMQSIEYARRQKAYKKLAQIFTSVLRLHPAKAELWIYAAQFATEEHGDMTEARSYMQRGLRFCKSSRSIWTEYIRLELAYIAKIHARRQILGVDGPAKETKSDLQEEGEDLLQLPKLTAEDVTPDVAKDQDIDELALQNLDNTPVMTGAIPTAIFDAAMTNFSHDPAFGHQIFDMAMNFGNTPVTTKIARQILDRMKLAALHDWHTHACSIAVNMIGQTLGTAEWMSGLRKALSEIDQALKQSSDIADLVKWSKAWLQNLMAEELDPAVRTVLISKVRSLDQAA